MIICSIIQYEPGLLLARTISWLCRQRNGEKIRRSSTVWHRARLKSARNSKTDSLTAGWWVEGTILLSAYVLYLSLYFLIRSSQPEDIDGSCLNLRQYLLLKSILLTFPNGNVRTSLNWMNWSGIASVFLKPYTQNLHLLPLFLHLTDR